MEKQLVENVAPHSVELSTNAKGKVQINVKVYAAYPDEAAKLALATMALTLKELGDKAASQ